MEIPAVYRNRGSACEHCNSVRRRNDTYVLQHSNGTLKQVGSSCIHDFLGNDEAAIIAAKAEIFALAGSVANDGELNEGGFSASSECLISNYLPVVAMKIRSEGWVSRTSAREQGLSSSTSERAWKSLYDKKDKITQEDIDLATDAEKWAEQLSDEQVNVNSSDYLHNVRAVTRTGLVSLRTMGIVASIISAYQRYLGDERKKAEQPPYSDEFLGEVGDKVTFGLPQKLGKRGQQLKNSPKVLSSEPVTLELVTGYENAFGYTYICKFYTNDGAVIVWKTGCPTVGNGHLQRADVGKRYTLAGTIKKHETYKNCKQTVLTRCSLEEIV
jgi:lambda repressor-like predicted transcriptional regulator